MFNGRQVHWHAARGVHYGVSDAFDAYHVVGVALSQGGRRRSTGQGLPAPPLWPGINGSLLAFGEPSFEQRETPRPKVT